MTDYSSAILGFNSNLHEGIPVKLLCDVVTTVGIFEGQVELVIPTQQPLKALAGSFVDTRVAAAFSVNVHREKPAKTQKRRLVTVAFMGPI